MNCKYNSSPSNINDGSKAAISRWAAWDCDNLNNNYVQYEFEALVDLKGCMATWYDDSVDAGGTGGCQAPE